MRNLNAMYDPAMGRREDFLRSSGPHDLDYKYQQVPTIEQTPQQAPPPNAQQPNPCVRQALSRVGSARV